MPRESVWSRHPVRAFATTRAALIVTGYLALTLFPAHPVESWQGMSFPDVPWLDGWIRWDSFWYESLIDPSPRYVPSYLSNANFLPFYSLVSWVAALPFRAFLDLEQAFFAGALIVSSVSFVLGLVAVERIATHIAGAAVATRTVWLIAVFPFSFFFTAVYADALYFCLCAWSLALALEQRWYVACALAAVATMTRIPGVALFPALGLEFFRQARATEGIRQTRATEGIRQTRATEGIRQTRATEGTDGSDRALARKAAVCLGILAMGPIVIASYYQWRYGNPLEFLEARQVGWNRASGIAGYVRDFNYFFETPIFPCRGVAECIREFAPTRSLLGVIYLALIPITIALVIRSARILGVALTTWALVSIGLALPNGFDGVGRFTAVLFPVFISAAMLLKDRKAFVVLCAVSIPLLLLFFAQFARWRQVL